MYNFSRKKLKLWLTNIYKGHWGTCPGLTFVYSHLNYLICEHDLDMIYVVGPGHGAPGILAALWMEGSLERFYPDYSRDRKGLTKLITTFSTTGGFPRFGISPSLSAKALYG